MDVKAKEAEWLDFEQAIGLVKAAGAGLEPHRALADWCGKRLVEARAATVTGGQSVEHDRPVDPLVFEHASRRGSGVNFSYFDGSLSCTYLDDKTGTEERWSAIGLSFRRDQLCKLLPHLPVAKIEAALANKKLAKVVSQPPESVAPGPAPSRRGRKPDWDKWTGLYLAAIELARDGRLTPEGFRSMAELKAEIALMMGNGAFKSDHADAEISQIYRKFCER